MSTPTAADMAKYCVLQLSDDDIELRTAVFELHRALYFQSQWPDFPRSTKRALKCSGSIWARLTA